MNWRVKCNAELFLWFLGLLSQKQQLKQNLSTPMRYARIYRTWLPSEIYSLLFTPILQHYHISEGFQRATKYGKFSRAAWGFDVVLNMRQQEVPEQKLSQIYDIALIYFTHFCTHVRQLQKFSIDTKFGDLIVQIYDQLMC